MKTLYVQTGQVFSFLLSLINYYTIKKKNVSDTAMNQVRHEATLEFCFR